MWICPQCERTFKTLNQSHSCVQVELDDLFVGKPENLLLTFDQLLIKVMDWEGCTVGATHKAIVFAKTKAWLIVRPMSKELDLKFYASERIHNPLIEKYGPMYSKKIAHHIRINKVSQVDEDLLQLLHFAFVSS